MLTQGARIVFYRILSHYNSLKVNTILNTTEQKWHSVKSGSHCNVFGMKKSIDLIVKQLQLQAKVFALAFSIFLLPKYVPFLEEIILKKEEE